MESKYLTFEKYTIPGRKTSLYDVINKNTSERLGAIYFYPGWRKFVFEPLPEIIFDSNCLTDIITFMKEAQEAWMEGLKSETKR